MKNGALPSSLRVPIRMGPGEGYGLMRLCRFCVFRTNEDAPPPLPTYGAIREGGMQPIAIARGPAQRASSHR